MNTLQERLDESGYTRYLADLNDDKRLRDIMAAGLRLAPNPEVAARLAAFSASIEEVEKALAAEYDATVAVVDSRNDVELEFIRILQIAEEACERMEKTDPKKAEEMRAALPLHLVQFDS